MININEKNMIAKGSDKTQDVKEVIAVVIADTMDEIPAKIPSTPVDAPSNRAIGAIKPFNHKINFIYILLSSIITFFVM